MKKKGKTALSARLTALCMAVLMAFSLLPSTASAAEGTSFGKITEEAEFTTGSYVMVTDTDTHRRSLTIIGFRRMSLGLHWEIRSQIRRLRQSGRSP